MAEIRAFRGIRYNPAVVGDLNQVITPPYDVIGVSLQEELYGRSRYNMVRLDLGKVRSGDDDGENRYTRSRQVFGEWLRAGVLAADAVPGLYWLEEDYRLEDGSPCTRKGFVGTVRIEDAGSSLYRPHEKTHTKPKEDRIRLTRACGANLSPIFSLYDDPEMKVSMGLEDEAKRRDPVARVTDDGGVETRMWCVTDRDVLAAVAAGMQGKSFFIADGHHRYETALAHRAWMREQSPMPRGDEPWNYVMMYLSNMRDPGLTVFPTHRAVFGLADLELPSLLERAGGFFEVQRIGDDARLLEAMGATDGGRHRFGMCAKGAGGGWMLTLREDVELAVALGDELPAVLHDLDVTILHGLILKRLLGISEESEAEQHNLRYVKGGRALLEAVAGEADLQLGFLLNPTRIDQVKTVAEAGQRMPQKSTFFYPKLVTGLVIHSLVGDREGLPSR
jgi:uncharacterized protein (DUF1015 family)